MGDLMLFLGIMAAFFLLWLFTGGPHQPSSQIPFVDLVNESEWRASGNTDGTAPSVRERQRVTYEIQNLESHLRELEEQIEKARIRGEGSPYEGQVYISRASFPEAQISRDEYVTLEAAFGNTDDINVTGWYLESAITGIRASIGTVSNLPRTNDINAQAPLILPPGGRVVVASGRSPIGTNFRLNKCIGYFEQFQDFTPSLPISCPLPREELERYGNVPITSLRSEKDAYDICEDFVSSLPQCQIYRRDLENVEPSLHKQCQSFVRNELTYVSCVENHQYETDFYQNEWRAFAGSVPELWKERRDIIKLLDRAGRTVDVFAY